MGAKSIPEMPTPRLKVVSGELVAPGTPPTPVSTLPPVTRLHDLKAIRRDMTKLYRAARQGRMDSAELGRFMFAARALGEMHERESIEPKVEELKKRIAALTAILEAQHR